MAEPLTETELTERLDESGRLETARGPGVYAIETAVPDEATVAIEQWDAVHDHRPPDDALARAAATETVLYVGASKNVYDRLCDHVNAKVRKASWLEAFPPVAVDDLTPTDEPFASEWAVASGLAMVDGVAVWCDGELIA